MPRNRSLLTTVTATVLLLFSTGTAHADLTDDELRTVTDEYVFARSLDEFLDLRSEKPYADQLDWSSDSCSLSPDEPLGYRFGASCNRHDFGYRNYQRQDRFHADTRRTLDDKFRDDMHDECGDDATCRGVATIYYQAVRQFGGSGSSTAEAVERADITVLTGEDGRAEKVTSIDARGGVLEVDLRN
ncbi:hypothetical protein GIY23_16600 [Allosaccharopolyspora coralli]|uniref:Phospholipase n=1 Tax=Allosaccharopolyspora coralli TaxID=2665642 RepID=A0A5Q3Q8C7_9PSEU|nr:phospholipase [Allosaccharopolyspora coralli]QGK70921.1 hypothetical protein GIY23_16600 [Allosaccharopolyspora coralli]